MFLLYPKILGIEKKFIGNAYFLKKYNMSSIEDVIMVKNDSHELVIIDTSFYINNEFIDTLDKEILSTYYDEKGNKLYLFFDYEIQIYFFEATNQELQILDIKSIALENRIIKVGLINSNIILESEKKNFYILDDEIVEKSIESDKIKWIVLQKSPQSLAKRYLKIHQGDGVSFHRVITELHSGKFFGLETVFLFFLSSLSIIFLVISSFVFGINYRKKNKL